LAEMKDWKRQNSYNKELEGLTSTKIAKQVVPKVRSTRNKEANYTAEYVLPPNDEFAESSTDPQSGEESSLFHSNVLLFVGLLVKLIRGNLVNQQLFPVRISQNHVLPVIQLS